MHTYTHIHTEGVAVSYADAKVIFDNSFYDDSKLSREDQSALIAQYFEFLKEISEPSLGGKLMDIIAAISCVLFLSKNAVERKIEELFKVIIGRRTNNPRKHPNSNATCAHLITTHSTTTTMITIHHT